MSSDAQQSYVHGVFSTQADIARLVSGYSGPELTAQRATVLECLDLKAGEAVLDVGCGPGFMMEVMAPALGKDGLVAGADFSVPMLEAGRERCADLPCKVEFKEGSASSLPFPDNSFDVVVCMQTLEYVPSVANALVEFRRVLKPTGRVLTLDTDWSARVLHSEDMPRCRRVLTAVIKHFTDPHLPPKMPSLLLSAGFAAPRAFAHPLIACGSFEPQGWFDTDKIASRAKKMGHDAAEADAFAAEQRQLSKDGRFYNSVIRSIFVAAATP